MQVDVIVVGQGLSGTWLTYYLRQRNLSFVVIDDDDWHSPSHVAAGLINPVTGRRHVTVWMAEELLPFCEQSYQEIGGELGIEAIRKVSLIDFFPTPQMRASFSSRVDERAPYLSLATDESQFRQHFNYDFGFGTIDPVYVALPSPLLRSSRLKLDAENAILPETFNADQLQVLSNGVSYGDYTASKIVFCDGSRGLHNPWFQKLPFAPNKGEALIVEANDLPRDRVYKQGVSLVPLQGSNYWWTGSNYSWEFPDAFPTTAFREETENLLKRWLRVSFRVVDHLAAVRPATIERRPFVGFHPLHPNIGILNGMGTKGVSLAPFFAKQMADQLSGKGTIAAEADVQRFTRLLSAG